MFKLPSCFPKGAAKHSLDGLLCIGTLCWAGLLIHLYTSVPWVTSTMIITLLVVGVLLGQLVQFLVVHKIWKFWQERRPEGASLAFRSIGSIIVRGYIRALVGELVLISAFALFHTSSLMLLQLITLSFTAMSIIATLLTSQYWRQQEKGVALFNVLCLGFGIQLCVLFLVKLL